MGVSLNGGTPKTPQHDHHHHFRKPPYSKESMIFASSARRVLYFSSGFKRILTQDFESKRGIETHYKDQHDKCL